MKKVTFVFFLTCVFSSCVFAQAHIADGLCKVFLEQDGIDGFVFIMEMRRNAVRDGAAFQFYPDGDVEKIAWYNGGKLDGTSRSFWHDGTPKSALDYRNGFLNGWVRHYDRQGRLQMQFKYMQGIPHGVGEYYEDGVLTRRVRYEDGRAVEKIRTEVSVP